MDENKFAVPNPRHILDNQKGVPVKTKFMEI